MIAKIRGFLRYFYSVPWCVPAWGWKEFASTATALTTGAIVEGSSANRFAAAVRDYLGMKHGLPVNRGRTAIELGLRGLGVGIGDDVVLPSFICRSVLDAVIKSGATPVFADIDATLNVTAATIHAALTPNTKCVIVAHLFGNAAPIDQIEAMLSAKGIALIDDAAQALGARCGGRLVGSFGTCGIVSCGPGKPLAGAAGGVLVTNDQRLFNAAGSIRLDAEPRREVTRRLLGFWMLRRFRRLTLPFSILLDKLRDVADEPAHVNAPLANLDAGIAVAQLEHLDRHAAERRRHGQIMLKRLAALGGEPVTDFSLAGAAVKLIWLLPQSGPSVGDAIDILARNGIEAQSGYSPLHASYVGDAGLPATAALAGRVLCLPLETRSRTSTVISFGSAEEQPNKSAVEGAHASRLSAQAAKR